MFYDIFVELCAKKGVKPTRAALDMGLSKATPTLWKNKGYTPRGDIINKIAAYFGVSVDYLLGNDVPFDQLQSTFPDTVGKRLELVRTKRNVSASELAQSASIPEEDLLQMERDEKEIRFDIAYKFCSRLGMDYHWLMTGENSDAHDKKMEEYLGPSETFENHAKEKLLSAFSKLNLTGQFIAAARVEELTQIEKYCVTFSGSGK